MAARYLIDTNVVIDYSDNKLPVKGRAFVASIIDVDPCFSIINKIELLGFADVNEVITELVETATIFDLSEDVVRETIAIRKMRRIKLPDAVIAATAIKQSLVLVTRNVGDFKDIPGLIVINPLGLIDVSVVPDVPHAIRNELELSW